MNLETKIRIEAMVDSKLTLQDELKRLKDEIADVERALSKEQEVARKELEPLYDYKVFVKVKDKEPDGWCSLPKGTEMVTINGRLLNKRDFDRHLQVFGCCSNMPDEKTSSVTYFRYNEVLLHVSGGRLLLRSPQLFTDKDWETLKGGVIKDEWLNKR